MDPHQASLQPILLLLGSRLRFNPTPTFLEVIFDRTLLFETCTFAEGQIVPMSQGLVLYLCFLMGPSKESLSLLYQAFLRPVLTYASPGWFPFLSVANITKLERLHGAASCAIIGSLSSTPILLLLLCEASLPPLRVTLSHLTSRHFVSQPLFPFSFG